MQQTRNLWAVLSLAVGILQAWDSGAFTAGFLVITLTLVGIVVPAAAIAATARYGVRFAALAAGFVLLTAARILSPVSLNTLHLALFVPAIYLIIGERWAQARKMATDRGR